MAGVVSWFSDTFNAEASEGDVIASRSLNITRIGAVVVPVLAGIWTAIAEMTDTPPFDDVEFQKTLIIALIPFVAVLSVADIFGRAITTRATYGPTNIIAFSEPLAARKETTAADVDGHVVAYRAGDSTGEGYYLFMTGDGDVSWEAASIILVGG